MNDDDNNALVIMSCDHGRLDEYGDAAGFASGGYKLLRSEYREHVRFAHDSKRVAEEWLHAIHMVLTYREWYPGDEPNPYIAVYDLSNNGDVLDEDLRLFAEVLRRYVSLCGI